MFPIAGGGCGAWTVPGSLGGVCRPLAPRRRAALADSVVDAVSLHVVFVLVSSQRAHFTHRSWFLSPSRE